MTKCEHHNCEDEATKLFKVGGFYAEYCLEHFEPAEAERLRIARQRVRAVRR